MSTLSQLRDRVEVLLMDTGNAIWDTDTIDEGLRHALDDYTLIKPLSMETVIALPGDGREIALNGISGLMKVTDVWWPFDSAASAETWPPNKVRGWRLYWDDALPVLILDIKDQSQPQEDDEMRIWYIQRQTIQDLDSASATTVDPDHESIIVLGAAAYSALSRTVDLVEVAGTDMFAIVLLGAWARSREREYRDCLKTLRAEGVRSSHAWGHGWALDKWDETHS